jgi:hypothetical protein
MLDGAVPLSIGGEQYLFPLSEGCYSMGASREMKESERQRDRETLRQNRKENNPSYLCLTFFSLSFPLSGVVGDNGGGTIMGDVFMQAFAVVFDRTNMKVGFGSLDNCPSSVDRSVWGERETEERERQRQRQRQR